MGDPASVAKATTGETSEVGEWGEVQDLSGSASGCLAIALFLPVDVIPDWELVVVAQGRE